MSNPFARRAFISVAVAVISIFLAGCPSGGSSGSGSASSKSLDGVYHAASGGPITITIKDKKANVELGGETKSLDYKVEGNKLTILNPKEGDVVFTINDDGTLSGELGLMKKGA